MRALTLTQPWVWIILNLGKRIENRSWNTSYRGTVLLHASRTCTERDWYSAWDFVADAFGVDIANRIPKRRTPGLLMGSIIGRAELVDVISPGWVFKSGACPPAEWEKAQKPWYMDQYGFILERVSETRAQPCKGALGLWTPSPTVLELYR